MVALIPSKRKTNYWSSSVTDPGMKKPENTSLSDLTSQSASPKFPRESVDFVSKTLFRTRPVFSRQDNIDLAPVGFCIKKREVVLSWFEDPGWPHLESAYAYLVKLVVKHKLGPSSSRFLSSGRSSKSCWVSSIPRTRRNERFWKLCLAVYTKNLLIIGSSSETECST
ncbi:hypothetical protein SLA2020_300230 [Shorea laevis]